MGGFPDLFLRTESPLCEMPCPWRGLLHAGLPVATLAADRLLPPERDSLPPCHSGLWCCRAAWGKRPPASVGLWAQVNPQDTRGGRVKRGEVQILRAFPGGSVIKNLPANTGERGLGSIPDEEVPPEKEMETHSSILSWRIPTDRGAWWATYSLWGRQELDMTERTQQWQQGFVWAFS